MGTSVVISTVRSRYRARSLYGTNLECFLRMSPVSRVSTNQAVSHRIADMKVRLETCRLLLYKAAWLKDQGQAAALDASITKLSISEAFVASSLDAVRIHGARGYLTEFQIERDLRDATGGLIYAGTSDIQRNLIARMIQDLLQKLLNRLAGLPS